MPQCKIVICCELFSFFCVESTFHTLLLWIFSQKRLSDLVASCNVYKLWIHSVRKYMMMLLCFCFLEFLLSRSKHFSNVMTYRIYAHKTTGNCLRKKYLHKYRISYNWIDVNEKQSRKNYNLWRWPANSIYFIGMYLPFLLGIFYKILIRRNLTLI